MSRVVSSSEYLTPTYSNRLMSATPTTFGDRRRDGKRTRISKNEIPENQMAPKVAYRIIHDELSLDYNPSLNLASFVNTWMDEEARKLANESINKNIIDHAEYPMTARLHKRTINIIAKMLHADYNPDNPDYPKDAFIGTGCVGSSEAVTLGLLAHKRKWQIRNSERLALEPGSRPNLFLGGAYQACWKKFYIYFDVEPRIWRLDENRYVLTAENVKEAIENKIINENTFAIGLVLGNTFSGQMDEIKEINSIVEKLNAETGWDIPIHIDAAGGGFILPFTRPYLEWDFRLSQVQSINLSNHKYGLVYPGMGTIVFRDIDVVPEDLFCEVDYLGGSPMKDYGLNFSRGSYQVVCQYYNFIRLGRAGYKNIMDNIIDNAFYLAQELCHFDNFRLVSDNDLFPSVVVEHDEREFSAEKLAARLRQNGWFVPAYPLPENARMIKVLRIVVKENFSHDMINLFLNDLEDSLIELKREAQSGNED